MHYCSKELKYQNSLRLSFDNVNNIKKEKYLKNYIEIFSQFINTIFLVIFR